MSEPSAIQLLAADLVREAGPLLVEWLKDNGVAAPNELLTVPQIAKELRLSPATVRNLINAGALHRAPDLREMRVKRSEVNAYGTRSK